jgi:hypothetical protein
VNNIAAYDMLEIIEARHQKHVDDIHLALHAPAGWHERIGREIRPDAILDRIIHNSY